MKILKNSWFNLIETAPKKKIKAYSKLGIVLQKHSRNFEHLNPTGKRLWIMASHDIFPNLSY